MEKNRVVNLVNFVRGCEPRPEAAGLDLYLPVVNQLAVDKQYGLPHTFLLQYDAMLREDFRTLFQKENARPDCEVGVWLELCRPLTEKVGIPWRGRPGYDWDWYVNPGFLMAYTPAQREQLIDELFGKFRELFGSCPPVAGCWMLDAHSMQYMQQRYGVRGFCCCREQYAVDAYTLWGGYYSGGYYPARRNGLCPAQTPAEQIDAPVFRMLGIDPLYGYDEKKYPHPPVGCCTLEPVWTFEEPVVDWYLQAYFDNPCVGFAQLTTGQENSFGWPMMAQGYRLQAERLAEAVQAGRLLVEHLGRTAERFRQAFATTPASALMARTDWAGNGNQSYWYSSRNYRANVFLEGEQLFFRDIFLFDDRYEERYLTEPCHEWSATYDNLPLVDNRLWSADGQECRLRFCRPVAAVEPQAQGEALCLQLRFADGGSGSLRLTPEQILLQDCGDLQFTVGTPQAEIAAGEEGFSYRYRGQAYRLLLPQAVIRGEAAGWHLSQVTALLPTRG